MSHMGKRKLFGSDEHRKPTLTNEYRQKLREDGDEAGLAKYEEYLREHKALLRRLFRDRRGEVVPGWEDECLG